MLGLLILLFVAVPLLEIWILLQLAEVVGTGATVALVLATGVVGGAVARRQGTRALRDVTRAAQAGRSPGPELAAGALFVAGAAFLLTPGVVTDVVGFLLMVPPVRRWAAARLAGRVGDGAVVRVEVGGPGDAGGGPDPGPKRVDAEARVQPRDGDGPGGDGGD